jgi:hypothetical protein
MLVGVNESSTLRNDVNEKGTKWIKQRQSHGYIAIFKIVRITTSKSLVKCKRNCESLLKRESRARLFQASGFY